jgi:hypothetical protein
MESGKTIRGFCEERNIPRNQYFYWQRELRKDACGRMNAQESEGCLPIQRFTEIMVTKRHDEGDVPALSGLNAASQAGSLRVEYRGLNLTVDAYYPTEKLAALIYGLAKPC